MLNFKYAAAALALAVAAPVAVAAVQAQNVAQVAMASPQHTTLVAAVSAAGLAETLSGTGPFTVFAPTNAAFERLPRGTVQRLLRPANRNMLRSVLTYHVVAGRVTAADLVQRIRAGNGHARLTTVQGGRLTARLMGDRVVLTDARGGRANVVMADIAASNGIIHATDAVSMPR